MSIYEYFQILVESIEVVPSDKTSVNVTFMGKSLPNIVPTSFSLPWKVDISQFKDPIPKTLKRNKTTVTKKVKAAKTTVINAAKKRQAIIKPSPSKVKNSNSGAVSESDSSEKLRTRSRTYAKPQSSVKRLSSQPTRRRSSRFH